MQQARMAKMDWTVSQERVVLREARAKTGSMARAAHRAPVVILATKGLEANEASAELMGNVERMAKTGLLEIGVSKDRRVPPVPVGSPEKKVTMASV